MPTVTYDGRSLSVSGRRVWLSAVEFEYSLHVPEEWDARLAVARQSGFNAIVASVPWSLHEARPGRTSFAHELDVSRFATRCAAHGLWLVLRIGPVVGGTFDGGGLPAWLADLPSIRLREPHPVFFERLTRWYRQVAEQVANHQATVRATSRSRAAGRATHPEGDHDAGQATGPLVAVQVEDRWLCGVPERASAYLDELVRFAREVGFDVPILTSNGAWAPLERTIDLWSGWDDLAANLRQLAAIESAQPRITVLRDPAAFRFVGARPDRSRGAAHADDSAHLVRLARVLASAGQFVVADGFASTHRRATVGRVALSESGARGFLASTPLLGSVADALGQPQARAGKLRRAASFASSFGHVLAQCEIGSQPIVVDPETAQLSVIPLNGPAGSAIFVFDGGQPGRKRSRSLTLLLRDGRRLPVHLADGGACWFLVDADLHGEGMLDYATVSPFAFVDRRILVFFGPAGAHAEISVGGTAARATVPAAGARTPTVLPLNGLTVVLCNERQIDATTIADESVVVDGMRVNPTGSVKRVERRETAARRATVVPIGKWAERRATDLVDGTSDRYVTLDGPASLSACGARDGYGWYRYSFRRASAGSATVALPGLADRARVWLDGKPLGVFGEGPGAKPGILSLRLAAGEHQLVLLVQALGRPIAGDHLGRRQGLLALPVEVRPLKAERTRVEGRVADPFQLRGFVYGSTLADQGTGEALVWKLPQKLSLPFIVDGAEWAERVSVPATLTLDGRAVARFGSDGAEYPVLLVGTVEPPPVPDRRRSRSARAREATPVVKSGRHELAIVFAGEPPRAAIDAAAKCVRLFEIARPLGASERLSFASFAPPSASSPAREARSSSRGAPSWWRGSCVVERPGPATLTLGGASIGLAYLNGQPLGRTGAGAGADEVVVPSGMLVPGTNDVVVFDEEGVSPSSASLRVFAEG